MLTEPGAAKLEVVRPERWLTGDRVHPNDLGHQHYAEMVIHFLATAVVPPRFRRAVPLLLLPARSWTLPPPMLPDNAVLLADQCLLEGQPGYEAAVVGSAGFASRGGIFHMCNTPGSYFALRVNTSLPAGAAAPAAGAENRTAVMLVMQKSKDSRGYAGERSRAAGGWQQCAWRGGGHGSRAHPISSPHPARLPRPAGVTCGGGCSCAPANFSTHLSEFGVQSHLEYMLVSRGDVCVLNITAHREAGAPEGEDVSWGGFLVGVRGAVVSTDAALRPPRGLLLGERLERMETQGNAHHMPSLLV